MARDVHWDIIRVLGVFGGILGIILSILMFADIWGPIGGVFAPDWLTTTIVILLCCFLIFGYAILGWQIWEIRYTFFLWIILGILLIVLVGNLAGIILIVAAIPIPFGG